MILALLYTADFFNHSLHPRQPEQLILLTICPMGLE